jgi:hypothetical protein
MALRSHRLDEIVKGPPNEISYLTRACVTFSIAGVLISEPTAAKLDLLRHGEFVMLALCASKPDQFGEEHCPFPSVLPFDVVPSSAAAAVASIERETPCHGAARRTTPLFAMADGNPYSYAILNCRLHQLLHGIFGEAVASTLSWHSIRIGLACALHAVNCPDTTIQLICRWASPDSLKLYRLIGSSSHISWCDRAATASFDAVRVTSIPSLDNSIDYAALAAPTSRARAESVVAAVTTSPRPPLTPPLAPGTRLEILWADPPRFFAGTCTSTRARIREDGTASAFQGFCMTPWAAGGRRRYGMTSLPRPGACFPTPPSD